VNCGFCHENIGVGDGWWSCDRCLVAYQNGKLCSVSKNEPWASKTHWVWKSEDTFPGLWVSVPEGCLVVLNEFSERVV